LPQDFSVAISVIFYPNMARIVLASVLASAEAATLVVTYQDCGAKHAQVTDLQPTKIHTGATESLVGTGTSDEDVTSAHFTATVSALGAKLSECSGDGTKDIVCKLPMGAGKITVKALSFPIAKGTVSIPVEVKTSRLIPASLANVDVHIAAEDQNGESIICLDVHTAVDTAAPAPEEGACSSDEQSLLVDSSHMDKKFAWCGIMSTFFSSWLDIGEFNRDKFNDCFSSLIGISKTCSMCYGVFAAVGDGHCSSSCLFRPCHNSGCRSCLELEVEDLATCTGFTPADPCEGNFAITYQDCGAQHGLVTDLQPLSFGTGTQVTVIGTGTNDEDVTSAHFTATVSASGSKLSECSGDGTKDIVCKLPMRVGEFTVKALSFPIAKGTFSIPVEVKNLQGVPFANVEWHIAAEDQNGESLICLDVRMVKSGEEEVVVV